MLFNKKIILSFFCLLSFSVYAADIVVNGSGLAGTYTTISAGINAASPGDRVLVSNQSFPYQEDTIFINKSVTILPYNDVSHIHFEGHIKITLDSISELNLIGFKADNTGIWSVFNDTSRNSLTTVNIVDSYFQHVFLSQPKTSTYISYSTFTSHVLFSHGDIIASVVNGGVFLGDFDCSNFSSYNFSQFQNESTFLMHGNMNNEIGCNNSFPSECGLFSDYISFGNISAYSDTCNIIANDFTHLVILTKDFSVNVRNNILAQNNNEYGLTIYLLCHSSKGTNQFINNNISRSVSFNSSYCSTTNEYNFRDVSFRFLNNNNNNSCSWFHLANPLCNNTNYTFSNLNCVKNSIVSYNNCNSIYMNNSNGDYIIDSLIFIGPTSNSNNPNPSSEFLNLDLSLNTIGKDGGSYAWENIIGGTSGPGFGSIQNSSTSSKARITYLNLPTQIFDPANIKIKAKAVHGN